MQIVCLNLGKLTKTQNRPEHITPHTAFLPAALACTAPTFSNAFVMRVFWALG